ncbi:MAG TPA: LPS-assembly protein LptD [Pseudolabrys sp.]|nr:LPS-assembly protein LptD [Pseudolabrys sp.]
MAGPACARPPAPRPRSRGAAKIAALLSLLVCGGFLVFASAQAQQFTFPARPPRPAPSPAAVERQQQGGQKQMLVQAREIDYDYANNRVAAVGNVQIYYGGSTVEADKVIYDQKTKRLHAEGNVKLTEPDGKVTYGNVIDLSDDYRDGFVDSLRLETPEQTRMAAARAERTQGNFTVFHNGVYTACGPCKDDPKKPPLWQVKAARIIHDQGEKMIYFEDASLELYGHPIAYLPYFSTPDPSVKRKSGFLMPMFSTNSKYGLAVEIPYYWALAPDYDATFSPVITTKQGPMLQGEFRQRLLNGAWSIRAAGIDQLDPEYFSQGQIGGPTPGYRNFRGSVESNGQFALNDKWVWGWDALLLSDKTFLQDYNPSLSRYRVTNPVANTPTEGISQLYLTGKGDRSFFDIRSIYYLGFSEYDTQNQLPVIHPVLDYNYTFDHPVLGGELGYKINFTSLSRQDPEFDAINRLAFNNGTCKLTADPAVNPTNCVLRGIPGTYSRFSAEMDWKRSFTDSLGQVFTPFVSLRADAASMQIDNDPNVSNFIQTGDSNLVRGMPTIGLEYRYPFISVHSWGTQTVEPIVQVIARPNETQVNKWPNEDAQSFMFDDTNLFSVNKFSGWDRVEGGGRANYGVQYTMQFNRGGSINALFGESYQLFGQNSFAMAGMGNTGIDSGLDTTQSDYVGRVAYQPNSIFSLITRARFNYNTFATERFEVEGQAHFDRWSGSLLYGDYAAQPALGDVSSSYPAYPAQLGFLERRQGILGTTQVKLDANWLLQAGARYSITDGKFDQTLLGLGYIDDCLILAVNYITSYTYSGNVTSDHAIMFQLSLRTLGGTSVTQAVGGLGGPGGF